MMTTPDRQAMMNKQNTIVLSTFKVLILKTITMFSSVFYGEDDTPLLDTLLIDSVTDLTPLGDDV